MIKGKKKKTSSIKTALTVVAIVLVPAISYMVALLLFRLYRWIISFMDMGDQDYAAACAVVISIGLLVSYLGHKWIES